MRRFLVLLITLLPVACFAQSHYYESYVIKPDGDTLKGYIKYLNFGRWTECPTSIQFKVSRDDHKVLEFTPKTIREFHVIDHEAYLAYAGLISADGNTYPIAGFKLDTSKKLDTIFLKQVVKGKYLSLYYHNDRFKTRYFISENNGTPVELEYHLYFDNPNKMVARPMYGALLISLANKYSPGDEKLMRKITGIGFVQSDFEDFVNTINNTGKQP
ncbi:MAG: hypothetical protein JSU01_02545 [Bacteroidetes bacterium]|nr:hypothetical protein [Bacteroidota bacterium]